MNYPDSDRFETLLTLVLKFLPTLRMGFQFEVNQTGTENSNVGNNGHKKLQTEYKMLVGENNAKFIQTSPAVPDIKSS